MFKQALSPSTTQLRQFGWIGLFGFPLIALLVLWRFVDWQPNWVVWLLLGLGVLCGILAMVAPKALKPLFVLMMLVAAPIGWLISAILLRVIYYGLFTPMALFFKLTGRDAMHRKLEPDATTYWADHEDQKKPRAPASYLRMH